MREKNRIQPFLAKLEKIWKKFPDLRFQQIIAFILFHGIEELNFNSDSFYWEEEEWEQIFNSLIENYQIN